ncbi:MAG: hypothetical protein H6648_08780 [Caldilineae bacterium]|nr:hypothetical protein [Caldilineae bacterium]
MLHAILIAPLTVLLSLLLQEIPQQVPEIVDVTLRVLSLVLSIIGVTGGLRGVLEQLDIRLKGKSALALSWAVGLVLTGASVAAGWLPQPEWTAGGVYSWVVAYWPVITAMANLVRDKVYGIVGAASPA